MSRLRDLPGQPMPDPPSHEQPAPMARCPALCLDPEFNPYQAQRFRDSVILSVEKNRGGQTSVDLEFQKHFEYSCFDANGRAEQEKLIEERLYND